MHSHEYLYAKYTKDKDQEYRYLAKNTPYLSFQVLNNHTLPRVRRFYLLALFSWTDSIMAVESQETPRSFCRAAQTLLRERFISIDCPQRNAADSFVVLLKSPFQFFLHFLRLIIEYVVTLFVENIFEFSKFFFQISYQLIKFHDILLVDFICPRQGHHSNKFL